MNTEFADFFRALYQWLLSQLPPDAMIVRRACGHREVSTFDGQEALYRDMQQICKDCQKGGQ